MRKPAILLCAAAALVAAAAQSAKPTVIVATPTVKEGVGWAYNLHALQQEIAASIAKKWKDSVAVADAAPSAAAPAFTLHTEIVRLYDDNNIDAHSGGVASNTQEITVHYWLTDAAGHSVFDKKTTYDEASAGVSQVASAAGPGPMARDLEDDIASRIHGAKLAPKSK